MKAAGIGPGDVHYVNLHATRHIDGKVFQKTTINQNLSVTTHRAENRGQRHGCTQGLRQRALIKHDGLSANQVGRNAPERSWQVIEAPQLGVGVGYAIEN